MRAHKFYHECFDCGGMLYQLYGHNVLEKCLYLVNLFFIIASMIVNDILEVINPTKDIFRWETGERFGPHFLIGSNVG